MHSTVDNIWTCNLRSSPMIAETWDLTPKTLKIFSIIYGSWDPLCFTLIKFLCFSCFFLTLTHQLSARDRSNVKFNIPSYNIRTRRRTEMFSLPATLFNILRSSQHFETDIRNLFFNIFLNKRSNVPMFILSAFKFSRISPFLTQILCLQVSCWFQPLFSSFISVLVDDQLSMLSYDPLLFHFISSLHVHYH